VRFWVGRFECTVLRDGRFRLDGGAMFGVVPKPLWEKRAAPDARNRIDLGLNCLLVRGGGKTILVDTGIGDKWEKKHRDIYGIERGPGLEAELARAGVAKDEIDYVINTHLHFDHAGGNTVRDPDGALRLAFPRARYVVQRGNLMEEALAPNELRRASYLPENFLPVRDADRFDLVEGWGELMEGVTLEVTGGHQRWHQVVIVRDGKTRAIFFGDLVPTAAHVDPPYIMAYDHYPLKTLEKKKKLLGRAADEGWTVVLEHEPGVPVGKVFRDGERFRWEAMAEEAASFRIREGGGEGGT
jgi:glyoxylase-like metal-dependent hydrolase (beta-lactamase superfamily II)